MTGMMHVRKRLSVVKVKAVSTQTVADGLPTLA